MTGFAQVVLVLFNKCSPTYSNTNSSTLGGGGGGGEGGLCRRYIYTLTSSSEISLPKPFLPDICNGTQITSTMQSYPLQISCDSTWYLYVRSSESRGTWRSLSRTSEE